MTYQGSVLAARQPENEPVRRGVKMNWDSGRQTSLKEVRSWAQHATGILNTTTPEELHRDTFRTIIEEYISVPLLSRFLGGQVVKKTMEAQARLLHFTLDLKRFLNREINDEEYEYSRHAFVTALSAVIDSTSDN
jgi:hypothetical protein